MKHFHRLGLVLGWLALGMACNCADKAQRQARIEGLYLSAFEAIDGRHAARARENIEALAELHPQDKRLPTLWALLAIVEWRFEEALSLLEEALKSQPERADLWRHQGELLQSKKQCAKAKGAFEKALALQPKDSEVHQSLAECLLVLGEAEAALGHWRQAAEQAVPMRQAEAVFRAVEAMNAHGRPQEIGPWLESLLPQTEEPSFLWELIAHSHIQAGAFSEAVKALEEAVKTNPQELHYWEALSALYEREKAPPRAQEALKRGLEKVPQRDKAALHVLLAQACKRSGEQACLEEQVQKALEQVDAGATEQLRELAVLLEDIGQEAEALKTERVLADKPGADERIRWRQP